MKMKLRLYLSLGAVLLCLCALGVGTLVIRSKLALTTVIVAAHDLSARTKLTEGDFRRIEVPEAFLDGSIIRDADALIGDYVSLRGFIPQGSLIYHSMVETLEEAVDEPTLLLKAGQAVYALDVNLGSTAGNTLLKGQKIDLYGTVKINRETFVDILLKQVRVVGLKDKNGEEVTHTGNQIPKILLLAVEQTYVPVLTKLLAIGDVTLTPTAYTLQESECVPNTESTLWSLLDVQ